MPLQVFFERLNCVLAIAENGVVARLVAREIADELVIDEYARTRGRHARRERRERLHRERRANDEQQVAEYVPDKPMACR